MLRAVPKRAAHRKDVSLHRLRLDHAVGPYGFEQLIVRDQASSIFDQIRQNEKGLRAQEDALLRPGVATSPETLVQGIEPEGNKHFHRRSGSQTSHSARDGVQCIALAADSNGRSVIATPAIRPSRATEAPANWIGIAGRDNARVLLLDMIMLLKYRVVLAALPTPRCR